MIAQIMADRIIGMRTTLRESLEKLGSPLSWEHVTKQVSNQKVLFLQTWKRFTYNYLFISIFMGETDWNVLLQWANTRTS